MIITMRVNRDEEDKELCMATSQIKEGICWFARTVWENLLYSRHLSISGTRLQHKWIIHAATRVGIKLLSKLVMMKTKVTSNLSLCFTDSNDIDSLQWWCTISVWWKLMSFITCFHFQVVRSLWNLVANFRFESWFFVHDESVLPW